MFCIEGKEMKQVREFELSYINESTRLVIIGKLYPSHFN